MLLQSRMFKRIFLVCSLLCVAFFGHSKSAQAQEFTPPMVHQAQSTRGMVVSASQPASLVGREILASGGNAVDAAIAVAFALAVTWPEAGNIGGGGFMMVHVPMQTPICIDYRECAPGAAHRTMFAPGESTFTHKAVGVPGTVAGMALAHSRFGTRPWNELIAPSARLAREGFLIDQHLANSLNEALTKNDVQQEQAFAELRRVYGKPDGTKWQSGDRMVLPELAETLQRLADHGAREFYVGDTAKMFIAEMQRGGGLITANDLAEYTAYTRTPIHTTFRGFDVYGPPPPSSGGICLAQMLNVLETFDLRQQSFDSPRSLHLMTEAMRRTYYDRARYLADPAFSAIPDQLATKSYAQQLASTIDEQRATQSGALAPELSLQDGGPNTTHFSVVDAQGMAVANTYTLEASFGSKIVVCGGGFLLNNEMGDFNWYPGQTDHNGRIGTAPNDIAPKKRMLSSQTPVIVTRDGHAVLVTGTPGGRTIINSMLLVLIRVMEYEQDLAKTIAAPRFHHQWFPDRLQVERGSPEWMAAVEKLREMGHEIEIRDSQQGAAHSISVDLKTGQRWGVADWRRGGFAAGE